MHSHGSKPPPAPGLPPAPSIIYKTKLEKKNFHFKQYKYLLKYVNIQKRKKKNLFFFTLNEKKI